MRGTSDRERAAAWGAMSAPEIREDMLRQVLAAAHADAAIYFSVSEVGGRAVIAESEVIGHPKAERFIETLIGRPGVLSLERLRNPDALDSRSFQEGAALPSAFGDELVDAGVADRIRLLVYEGRRFAGWVGALRMSTSEARPFSRADRRRLSGLIEPVTRSVLEADRVARATLPAAKGFAVVTVGGEVEYCSAEGAAWLGRPRFTETLRRRMWLGAEATSFAVELAEARMTPMIGRRSPPLLLLELSRARSVEATAVRLSPAQREVANFAASGATIPEIAVALGRAPETVRTHLREAYTRLGVSNRVELARALAA